MLRVLILLAVIPLLCYSKGGPGPLKEQWFALNSYGDIWKDCSKPNDHAKITNVSIVPDPPVIGKLVNISATLTTNEVITGGEVNIKITYSFFPYTLKYDLCKLTEKVNYTCPLKKGTIRVSVPTKIPKEAPKGDYQGKVTATDQNNQELACIDLKMTLK